MIITSPEFENNEKIPRRFTGDGEDINPELVIEDIPKEAKSLVLIVDDPDAPAGTWTHWVVFNIPAEEEVIIKEDSIPGTPGLNSSRTTPYVGPCPPPGSGVHHYNFKIYALDEVLKLEEGASLKEINEAIKKYIIDNAKLIGVYFRY